MIWIYCKKPVDYVESLNTMENLVNSIISGSINENIALSLQHNDVYTAGSSAKESDLLIQKNIYMILRNNICLTCKKTYKN